MKEKAIVNLMLAAALGVAAQTQAADLGIGDEAPALKVDKWVKGDAVNLDKVKGKGVVVVEFWATWCGPCIASIPHLTELQHDYGRKGVTIVGVTKFDEGNTLEMVEEFVRKQGDKLGYGIAFEKEPNTSDAYMEAADQNGIPTAFVVDKQGRVAWIGHPMSGLDRALDEIIAGTYDIVVARKIFDLRAKMSDAWAEGDFKTVLKLADERIAIKPDDTGAYRSKFRVYLDELDKPKEARVAAKKVIELAHNDAMTLAEFAQDLLHVGEEHDFNAMAMQAVKRALELQPNNTDAAIANFQILAAMGKESAAIDWATQSVKRMGGDASALARFARALSKPARADRCTALAIEAVDLAIKAEPEKAQHLMTKFDILAVCKKDIAGAERIGRYLVEKAVEDAPLLNNFAWNLLTEDGLKGKFNELALLAAKQCDKTGGGENWMHVDTLALAMFENGVVAEAITLEKKAIKLAGDNPAIDELKKQLERFEKKGKG